MRRLALVPLVPLVLLLFHARADELERRVATMARVGGCWSPSFSPDGSRIAFVSNLSGQPQVWIVPSAGGFPSLATPLDEPVGFVTWSPEGSWLALTSAPGGGMNEQVWLVRPDGTDLRRLTPGGRETNRLSGFSRDGRLLRLASNARTGASIDAYLLAVATGATDATDATGATRATSATGAASATSRAPGINGYSDLSRDGRRAVLERLGSRGDNDLFLVDVASGAETLLTPHEKPGSFSGGVFSPDGRTVYLSSNAGRDTIAFARVRLLEDGRPGPIEVMAGREDAELSEFDVDDSGETAVLVWNAAGRSELAFLDLASGKSRPGPALPSEIAGSVAFSRDGSRVVMALSGAAAPSDIWVLERGTGRLRQVTKAPHPGVDLARAVRPTLVRYPARDGLPLSGWLYRPEGTKGPVPLVLAFHGGPEGQERPSFRSDYQALLSQGIAVLAPNVRGSSGFGKRFVNLDNGALRKNAVTDIAASVDFVVKERIADPKRIGIMGGSYGGYMTMAGLTEFPDLFAAAANLFGIVNFETFFANTEPWMAAISKVEYGDPETQKEMLRGLSPIHRLDRVLAPTLVLHGANDTNCPVVEAEQVVENLRKRGVPVEYVLFPDEGHGWRKVQNRIRSTVALTRWFVKYLAPSP